RTLGAKRAMQLYVESARIPASQCLEYGLVNKVIESGRLRDEAAGWAKKLAEGAPLAHKLGKQCMHFAMQNDLSSTIDLEAKLQVTASTSADSQAAITAFFNKAKPVFTGK
ncbi:MAG: hypothetical protein HKO07_02685, partial [Pseudomonadales bacterium]|nr:hypothetical protein [Pseudomonadales bacterium]